MKESNKISQGRMGDIKSAGTDRHTAVNGKSRIDGWK